MRELLVAVPVSRNNVKPALAADAAIFTVVAVTVVNVPAAAVVPPIAGGLDKSSVPPSVRFPELVTVPVKVKPLTVPVPPTEVTVPPDPVADKVPLTKLIPEPIVTLLKPPVPLPYSIDVPLVCGAYGSAGMSATTRLLNVGTVAAPDAGPART